MPSSRIDCVEVSLHRIRSGAIDAHAQQDWVAQETPIALEYNGISHATMLASPTDLEDFATGFSLSEGIVGKASDIRGIELQEQSHGIVVQLDISTACAVHLKERRRAMAGRTGCGLCGVETLPEVIRPVAPVASAPAVSVAAVLRAMQDMRQHQTLHELTGATHAAAWADAQGQLRLVREDVGRHNALDKLIGALVRQDIDPSAGIILVSSRASFEMVQKTAAAGCGILAAVSAPTALAIHLAESANIALLGFLRQNDASIYAHPERLCA